MYFPSLVQFISKIAPLSTVISKGYWYLERLEYMDPKVIVESRLDYMCVVGRIMITIDALNKINFILILLSGKIELIY